MPSSGPVRCRHDPPICDAGATAVSVDSRSAVCTRINQIGSKRFAKRQQMQGTKKGGHLLLQMRTRVVDNRLEETFQKWYPGFRQGEIRSLEKAA
jgi:hypothetical protein